MSTRAVLIFGYQTDSFAHARHNPLLSLMDPREHLYLNTLGNDKPGSFEQHALAHRYVALLSKEQLQAPWKFAFRWPALLTVLEQACTVLVIPLKLPYLLTIF